MEKRNLLILILWVAMVILTCGCSRKNEIKQSEHSKENEKELEVMQIVPEQGNNVLEHVSQEDANNLTKSESESTESSTTTKPSNKTEDKTSSQEIAKDAQTSNQEEQHIHMWVERSSCVRHPEKGHYETQVVEEAYDEETYAWRTFCNKCNEDITDLGAEGITIHSAILCESGYHNDYVVVNTIHYDAVTERVWVVDTPAYAEIITTYTCGCGVVKD